MRSSGSLRAIDRTGISSRYLTSPGHGAKFVPPRPVIGITLKPKRIKIYATLETSQAGRLGSSPDRAGGGMDCLRAELGRRARAGLPEPTRERQTARLVALDERQHHQGRHQARPGMDEARGCSLSSIRLTTMRS